MKKILCILSLLFAVYTAADAQLLRSVLKKQPQKTVTNRSQNNDDGLLINRSSAGRVPAHLQNRNKNNGLLIDQSSPGVSVTPRQDNGELNIDKSSVNGVMARDLPHVEDYSSSASQGTTSHSSSSSSSSSSKSCSQCHGLKSCRTCGGSGHTTGFTVTTKLVCSTCNGKGICPFCKGTGIQ